MRRLLTFLLVSTLMATAQKVLLLLLRRTLLPTPMNLTGWRRSFPVNLEVDLSRPFAGDKKRWPS